MRQPAGSAPHSRIDPLLAASLCLVIISHLLIHLFMYESVQHIFIIAMILLPLMYNLV